MLRLKVNITRITIHIYKSGEVIIMMDEEGGCETFEASSKVDDFIKDLERMFGKDFSEIEENIDISVWDDRGLGK